METNTGKHAEIELDILSESAKDPDNRPIIEPFRNEILALVDAFGKSGQSGGSAPFTASAIAQAVKKLCLFETICPITGLDREWMEVSHDCFQNNRLSSVFKDSKASPAYYLNAIVWKGEDDYHTFTGRVEDITSRQYIKSFPFEPKTFYIDVTADRKIKDKKQLDAVWEYYDRYEQK